MRRAMRSFTEPPGLKYSTLARTVALIPLVTLLSRTSGVLPTRLIIESWNCTVVFEEMSQMKGRYRSGKPIACGPADAP
ncbi:hypothetical protein SVIOM342S_02855 [Streptomyces violaceorubidus]